MIIGIDTGGTKTLVTAFDSHGRIINSFKYETPKNTHKYTEVLKSYLTDTYSDTEVEAIVIGLPGFMDNQVAVWAGNLGWHNFNLHDALYGVLHGAPIYIENDAKLSALGAVREMTKIPESVLYIAIGTGIGTAVIENGQIDTALKHSEGGRMTLEYDGVLRQWESFASGRAIRETYGKYARDITSSHTWKEIAKRISRGLLASIPLVQPDAVVIGGSIGTYFDNYSVQLTQILREHLPSHIPIPKLIKAKHPEEAVVYGCYYYAIDKLATKKH